MSRTIYTHFYSEDPAYLLNGKFRTIPAHAKAWYGDFDDATHIETVWQSEFPDASPVQLRAKAADRLCTR